VRVGLAHLFLRHTSAGLTLNENASHDVRRDFAAWFDRAVPEDARTGRTRSRAPTTCPRTSRAALLGTSLQLPVRDGRLHLGTWQGVYLCELRDRGGPRTLTVTLQGE
jgi:secondary thiamine-phosphate synthase enzyme